MTLLDTHTWLWWLSSPELLSAEASRRIDAARQEANLVVSAFSVWEAAMLVKKGRLDPRMPLDEVVASCEQLPFLAFLPVTPRIAIDAVSLEPLHADPADRLIVATARAHNAVVVTKDRALHAFPGLVCVW